MRSMDVAGLRDVESCFCDPAPADEGIRITFVKSRGGLRGSLDLHWQA